MPINSSLIRFGGCAFCKGLCQGGCLACGGKSCGAGRLKRKGGADVIPETEYGYEKKVPAFNPVHVDDVPLHGAQNGVYEPAKVLGGPEPALKMVMRSKMIPQPVEPIRLNLAPSVQEQVTAPVKIRNHQKRYDYK